MNSGIDTEVTLNKGIDAEVALDKGIDTEVALDKGIDMEVTCAGSGEKEKIKIVFSKSKNYDSDYESDLIKYIKSTNLLDETDLSFKNGYIFRKSGGFSIDEPQFRDMEYEWAYIRKRDNITIDKLNEVDQIDFIIVSNEEEIEGLLYPNYFEDIKNDTKGIILKDACQIVLECSKINILFTYPNLNDVTFTLEAIDKIKGFTRKELADKILQYYHMLYYLSKNYDSKKGEFIQDKGDGIFNSICDWEYEKNGVLGLEYIKKNNTWEVICMNYI